MSKLSSTFVKLSQKQLEQKYLFIQNYKNANNAAEGSNVDANSNVAVTAGARIAVNGLNPEIDGHETMDVTVPVVFAFSL